MYLDSGAWYRAHMQTPHKPNLEVHVEEIHIEDERVTIASIQREPETERRGLACRTNVRGGLDTNQGP